MSEMQIRFWCVECDRPIRDIVESNAHSGQGHSLVMVPSTLVRDMNALRAELETLKNLYAEYGATEDELKPFRERDALRAERDQWERRCEQAWQQKDEASTQLAEANQALLRVEGERDALQQQVQALDQQLKYALGITKMEQIGEILGDGF